MLAHEIGKWYYWTDCIRIFVPSGETSKTGKEKLIPVTIRKLFLVCQDGEEFLPSEYRVTFRRRDGRTYFYLSSKKRGSTYQWQHTATSGDTRLPVPSKGTDADYSKEETLSRDEFINWMGIRFPSSAQHVLDALLMCSEGQSPAIRIKN